MKSNKGIYILLPLVFVVWGVIAYRMVKYLKQDSVVVPQSTFTGIEFTTENFKEDTFYIVADYRDPFLGEVKKEIKKVTKPLPKPVIKPAAKAEAPWPSVTFHGLIKNRDSKKAYALLSINGKRKSLIEKEEWQGLIVVAIEGDSITLAYNKQKRSFKKVKR